MRAPHARAPFHALRSAAVGLAAVTLAAGAHVVGGGGLPVPAIMLALLALTGLAATLATRLRLGFPAMASVLGLGQLVLHEALTAFGQAAFTASAAAPHHPAAPLNVADAAPIHLHTADPSTGATMFVAHALATLATALLLAKGEQALWQLAAWLSPLVDVPHVVFMPDAGSAPSPIGSPSVFLPRPWRNLRQDSRRGPPAVVVLP